QQSGRWREPRSGPIGKSPTLLDEARCSHSVDQRQRSARVRGEAPAEDRTEVRIRDIRHHDFLEAARALESLYIKKALAELVGRGLPRGAGIHPRQLGPEIFLRALWVLVEAGTTFPPGAPQIFDEAAYHVPARGRPELIAEIRLTLL